MKSGIMYHLQGQQLPTQGRKHHKSAAQALRPMAQGKGGIIVREVLSGSQR